MLKANFRKQCCLGAWFLDLLVCLSARLRLTVKRLQAFFNVSTISYKTGFELVEQNRFAKITKHSKQKGRPQGNVFGFASHFTKNARVLTKFCKLNSFFV